MQGESPLGRFKVDVKFGSAGFGCGGRGGVVWDGGQFLYIRCVEVSGKEWVVFPFG